jgi:energy-coupling factor transport system substrate-specific component
MKRSELSLNVREMVLFAILGAMTFSAKYVMSFLPNIEPVSLMVMLFAVVFGWKWVYPVYLYVVMEILFYGISLWNINYLYIWAVLAVVSMFLKDMKSPLAWALLSGVFGLLFGALCGIVDVFIGGFSYAVTKWVSGIPFDIAHCAGNFVIALLLFKPLRELLAEEYAKMGK